MTKKSDFSLDDILNEIDNKRHDKRDDTKSKSSYDITDILKGDVKPDFSSKQVAAKAVLENNSSKSVEGFTGVFNTSEDLMGEIPEDALTEDVFRPMPQIQSKKKPKRSKRQRDDTDSFTLPLPLFSDTESEMKSAKVQTPTGNAAYERQKAVSGAKSAYAPQEVPSSAKSAYAPQEAVSSAKSAYAPQEAVSSAKSAYAPQEAVSGSKSAYAPPKRGGETKLPFATQMQADKMQADKAQKPVGGAQSVNAPQKSVTDTNSVYPLPDPIVDMETVNKGVPLWRQALIPDEKRSFGATVDLSVGGTRKIAAKQTEQLGSAISMAIKENERNKYVPPPRKAVVKTDSAILKADFETDEPTDLIASVNAFEVAAREESTAELLDNFHKASTIGLAGNDLKNLAAKNRVVSDNALTTVVPSSGSTSEKAETIKEYKPSKFSNTEFLTSLKKAVNHKEYNENKSEDMTKISINLPTHGLNIDYKNQIIDQTSNVSDVSDGKTTAIKIDELQTKRKRKISDFVLDNEELDYEYEDEENKEFVDYDSTTHIFADLCESHKGLNTRFIILLIVTLFAVIITFLGDIGVPLNFNLFGSDFTLFDKRFDPTSFVFLFLCLGIIGMGLCSSVILGGITKLFKGKADCDSICAVSAVLPIILAVINLANTDYLQRSRCHIYIAVGLVALLFNTLGKIFMIVRAKRNFAFISGDSRKYYADVVDLESVNAFTHGMLSEVPFLVTMRKTEFLTDFLANSYCTDKADRLCKRLVPAALLFSVFVGVLTFFIPNGIEGMTNNIYWAITAFSATLSVLSPFTIMFLVNSPFSRTSKKLMKSDAVLLGYEAAENFQKTNSVLIDASLLFPAGSVKFMNIKQCKSVNSNNNVLIDEAIILAASIAFKSNSILHSMFFDMIGGKSELLVNVDNCIYEDNMGVLAWVGTKRMMLGNRDLMKHHSIKVPDVSKENKYAGENGDAIYLAINGETVASFFITLIANNEIKLALNELVENGVSIVVKTNDAPVTAVKIADLFDIPPERVRILPFRLHDKFKDATKYTSKGNSGIACNGTFTSFAKTIVAAKRVYKSINWLNIFILGGLFVAAVCVIIFSLFVMPNLLTPTNIIVYNLLLFLIMQLMLPFIQKK